VKGPQFAALHLLFDEVAAAVDGLADEVAERAVVLGGYTGGTLATVVRATRLPVYPPEIACGNDHSWAMSAALAQAARGARTAIRDAQDAGDDGSADVLTQVSRELDTLLWKVEAHVALEPR
jgi:starvation-inducible DNA-binding protein